MSTSSRKLRKITSFHKIIGCARFVRVSFSGSFGTVRDAEIPALFDETYNDVGGVADTREDDQVSLFAENRPEYSTGSYFLCSSCHLAAISLQFCTPRKEP